MRSRAGQGWAYTRAMPGIKALLEIMARLRNPDGGCPWDLAQDFSSISPHTLEEAYEVDEAIASGDLESLRDELGDLLFQVVFQARIAEELGAFDFEGVTEAITSKLIRRHPHIFAGAATPSTVEDQVANWESIKAEERAAANRSGGGAPDPFVGIPRNLPALARSIKLAGRLARIEPPQRGGASSGTPPPAAELPTRLAAATQSAADLLDPEAESPADRERRLRVVGEGLRVWVWLARELGVDAEQALRLTDDQTLAWVRQDLSSAPTEGVLSGVVSDRHQAGKSRSR